jgi:hypothetical protein
VQRSQAWLSLARPYLFCPANTDRLALPAESLALSQHLLCCQRVTVLFLADMHLT